MFLALCTVQMMSGYLRASGLVIQRDRVRQSLKRVDTLGSASRWSRTVTRRTYSVPTPNSLWHLDAHMKLIRFASYVVQTKMLPTCYPYSWCKNALSLTHRNCVTVTHHIYKKVQNQLKMSWKKTVLTFLNIIFIISWYIIHFKTVSTSNIFQAKCKGIDVYLCLFHLSTDQMANVNHFHKC